MKKFITGALALTTVVTMSMANDDFYVGVGTAMEMVDNELIDDIGTALEVKVGKKFDNNFGIEGKITKTIILAEDDSKHTYRNDGTRVNYELDILTYSIWGTYTFPLTNDLRLVPKVGFLKEDVTLKENRGTTKVDDSGIVFGIDIKKSFPDLGFDIYAGLYTVEKDVTHLSFGIEKNF